MEKIKVNNQVVSMRKFVKQAKIHTINKCTKQIKFLENRKGNEVQMAKTKRKLQRLLEEVNILKKIAPDSVSKLALSKAKDWKAVLAEKNVPLEERCFAMLANHPPVQESVEKFHSDNSELISKIPELVKEWEEKKSRSSQINKKKQKGKQEDSNDPNKLPIGNKNNFHKSNEAQIKHPNIEPLKSLPDKSDIKSIQNDINGKNLKIKATNKRKESSVILSDCLNVSSTLCSPPKKKILKRDSAESNESDECFSDSSNAAAHADSGNKTKLQGKEEIKSDQSSKSDSDGSLSDSSDIVNQKDSQNKQRLPLDNGGQSDQSFKSGSDDSLSDGPDIKSDQSSEDEEKLPVKDEIKSEQSCKNSKRSNLSAVSHKNKINQKRVPLKKDLLSSECNNKNKEENSEKSLDIRSRLLEISTSKVKEQIKPKSKHSSVLHQLNAGVETDTDGEDLSGYKRSDNSSNVSVTKTKLPIKPEVKNKMKAITVLDLNKLQDLDEIPIEKSDVDSEDESDEDSGKQRKDPFFLRDGEPVTESEDEESMEKDNAKKRDFPPFKRKPYADFSKKEQRDHSFQKRKFDKHSVNGRSSNFREKGFNKNKEFSFKDNKRNLKRTFNDNSEYKQNKKFQFASRDKFSNQNGANSFAKNPKEKSFSQNHNRDIKGKSHPPKSNLNNSSQTIKSDDKPMHPSWEAKRKLKEAQKLKFQGKRMVFNL